MQVRLLTNLKNIANTGDVVELPEEQALSYLERGLAESVAIEGAPKTPQEVNETPPAVTDTSEEANQVDQVEEKKDSQEEEEKEEVQAENSGEISESQSGNLAEELGKKNEENEQPVTGTESAVTEQPQTENPTDQATTVQSEEASQSVNG